MTQRRAVPACCVTSRNLAMIPHRSPTVDPTKILTRQELRLVLADLKRQAERSKQGHVNLILFRLAACCGLRVSEIAHLHMADVRTDGPRPHLRIRKAAAKGHKARVVPLWWDAGTLADITAWKSHPHESERRSRRSVPRLAAPGPLGTSSSPATRSAAGSARRARCWDWRGSRR